jgi:hypothetical protein
MTAPAFLLAHGGKGAVVEDDSTVSSALPGPSQVGL